MSTSCRSRPLRGEDEKTDSGRERFEWIIQRCTQKWVGTDLQYEDWPAAAFAFGLNGLLTRSQMVRTLGDCHQRWLNDEFKGHNVANCRCPGHAYLRARFAEVRDAEVAR